MCVCVHFLFNRLIVIDEKKPTLFFCVKNNKVNVNVGNYYYFVECWIINSRVDYNSHNSTVFTPLPYWVFWCYKATHWAGCALLLQSCQLSAPRYSAHRLIGRPPASKGPLWFAECPDAWEHLTQQNENITIMHLHHSKHSTTQDNTGLIGPKTYPPVQSPLCLVRCGMW